MISFTPVQRVANVTRQNFVQDHKLPAVPVVVEQLTAAWPACEKWSLDYLQELAGDTVVPLYDSQRSRDRKHQHAPALKLPLREYLQRIKHDEKELRLFFFNFFNIIPELREDFSYPEIGLPFFKKLPVLFIGGKGATVQLHFDIDLADILLCHFGGRKRIYLFAPDQTPYLYRVPFSFSALFDARIDSPDFEKYPALQFARGQIAELQHGEALYIPSGYWHYVEYLEPGMSMSLRAFPRTLNGVAGMLYNLLVLRSIDGLMRKTLGQVWNDRNERRARQLTHRHLGLPDRQ
ncbi:MAG: cupin-like domain-containing protein [Wenzhouxiangellaceae bacterium]|nr:cupin-like domain-containing protein [Wenzhouxiangellaceae bacterium]